MGHSLGEYGALVAAGALTFDAALEAVSARGREMAQPVGRRQRRDGRRVRAAGRDRADRRRDAEGYVVVANINSNSQAVIGGATDAVAGRGRRPSSAAGMNGVRIPVSHAFHTDDRGAGLGSRLVATLRRLDVRRRSCRSSPT